MHNLLAGLMGVFASFSSFFHGGQPVNHPMMNNATHSATVSGTLTPGGGRRDDSGRMVMQNGERSFFGTVTAIDGSTLTLQTQRPVMMMRLQNVTMTPPVTPPAEKTITITLDSTTTYTGGSQSDITTGTKIAGIGKATSDTAITAVKLSINPAIPSGSPSGMRRGRGMHPGDPDDN